MKILILAGNISQAQKYTIAHREAGNDYFYASGEEAILKNEVEKVETVGTFWERENAQKLYDLAQSRIGVSSK